MNPEIYIGVDPDDSTLTVYRRAKSFCPDADTRTIPVQYWQYRKTANGTEVMKELLYFHANDIPAEVDNEGNVIKPEVLYYTKWDTNIGRTPVESDAQGCWTSIEDILSQLPINARNNYILGRG